MARELKINKQLVTCQLIGPSKVVEGIWSKCQSWMVLGHMVHTLSPCLMPTAMYSLKNFTGRKQV